MTATRAGPRDGPGGGSALNRFPRPRRTRWSWPATTGVLGAAVAVLLEPLGLPALRHRLPTARPSNTAVGVPALKQFRNENAGERENAIKASHPQTVFMSLNTIVLTIMIGELARSGWK